jgi:hypothetical protein
MVSGTLLTMKTIHLLFLFLASNTFLAGLRLQGPLCAVCLMWLAEQATGAPVFRSSAFVVHGG